MPDRVVVRVDRELTLLNHVEDEVLSAIKVALEFDNVEKEQAKSEEFWGWDELPDKIKMWRTDEEDRMVMPRGFATQLRQGMDHFGIKIDWEDGRRDVSVATSDMEMVRFDSRRSYQELAVERILSVQQGIWQAPPGAGKTVAVLEAIRRSEQRSLVIVNQAHIARQWVERAERFLGYTPGIVGDGQFDVRKITIAMQQTLWKRFRDLTIEGFFELFGFVCLDECHHLPAHTFTNTIQAFDARIRIGVSATPALQKGMIGVIESVLGPVFHVTEKQVLRDKHILVKPQVLLHPTGFTARFWPTHKPGKWDPTLKKFRDCDWKQSGCSSDGKRVHRNNYTDVVKLLTEDEGRNALISYCAQNDVQYGRTAIVLSDRLEHLRTLRQLCISEWGIAEADAIMFTGEQTSDERMDIAMRAEAGGCVLFSTIANEALDIPRLDSIHFAYPFRNTELAKQRVGRVERYHPEKTGAWVHEYEDDVSVLKGQLKERRREVYARDDISVTYA
jgi:superfamily II DNA or RNA helicase